MKSDSICVCVCVCRCLHSFTNMFFSLFFQSMSPSQQLTPSEAAKPHPSIPLQNPFSSFPSPDPRHPKTRTFPSLFNPLTLPHFSTLLPYGLDATNSAKVENSASVFIKTLGLKISPQRCHDLCFHCLSCVPSSGDITPVANT